MCGIAGIVGPKAHEKRAELAAMLEITRHRGPDETGTHFSPGVALGHNRLSVLDLSPAGRNPMFSPDRRLSIVYNGEVFNYQELKEEIGEKYPFRTATDTEVVLAACSLWGGHCLDKFIGMFALAVWDHDNRELFCARDRFGIKPFYFAEFDGHLYFASEIKSLLAAGLPRIPDYSTIYRYLKWGLYDFDAQTFFSGIKRLEPGCCLTWNEAGLKITRYWDIRADEGTRMSENQAANRVLEILEDAVHIALRSDVPLGVNLSGGLDSSTLAALLKIKAQNGQPLEGFTQDYADPKFSERPWVLQMAELTGRTVHFAVMGPEAFRLIHPALEWFQDEPYGGVPVAGYVGTYQQALRRGVVVLLDGNGLDEALGGYRSYHSRFLRSLALASDPDLGAYIDGFAREWSVSADEVRKGLWDGESLAEARDGTKAAADWIAPGFEAAYGEKAPEFPAPFASPLKNAMYRDLRLTKIPRALRFNDRVSMAFSRELRVPFLDHRLFELTFSLPDKMLFAGGRPKGLLRKRLAGILPDGVRLAPKRHVQTPQSEWFSGPLRAWAGDVIRSSEFRRRGIIDADKAIGIFNKLEGRSMANSFFLWQAVNLESWFQTSIDTPNLATKPPEFPVVSCETVGGNGGSGSGALEKI